MSFLMWRADLERLVPLRAVAALGHHRLEVDEGAVEEDLCETREATSSQSGAPMGRGREAARRSRFQYLRARGRSGAVRTG